MMTKGGLNRAEGLQSKSRAGEFGLSIAGITNNAIKRKLYKTYLNIVQHQLVLCNWFDSDGTNYDGGIY